MLQLSNVVGLFRNYLQGGACMEMVRTHDALKLSSHMVARMSLLNKLPGMLLCQQEESPWNGVLLLLVDYGHK